MRQRVKLHITGVVQGVGFRPHVFRLSKKFNLGGCVFNDVRGVTVELEGDGSRIKDFIAELKVTAPAASSIHKIKKESLPLAGEEKFSITKSACAANKSALFPADIAVCGNCRGELFAKNNRRYLFPFINCTNCGPRLTIVEDIPYDRKKTTMKHFKMCRFCREEYHNHLNRRFHAEPNACFSCGPQIELLKTIPAAGRRPQAQAGKVQKNNLQVKEILKQSAKFLFRGKIIAIKGIGGYHLACDAKNISAVRRLRRLKKRPTKPFAVMVDDLSAVLEICQIAAGEKSLMESPSRPITLLEITKKNYWTAEVCPEQNFLGVMLCYAPLHYLLFNCLKEFEESPVLVMTSANKGDFPLVSREDELFQIKNYADYFLTHNRPIHLKCDDSIARIFRKKEVIIRKARGYAPDFMGFTHKKEILACGAELKSTFSVATNGRLVSSPYLGDLKNYENYKFYLKTLSHFKKIFSFNPGLIAHDLHPSYLSTQYALSLKKVPKFAVQHHHAHLAACLFENNLDKKVIGVCFDGAGLGPDGAIWGGEFLIADKSSFLRAGHFKYFGLLGADKAVEEPARAAFYVLYDTFGGNLFKLNLACIDYFRTKEKNIFCKLIKNKQTVMTSSAGRLFDAAASILGAKFTITYEAEAAILLEMLARQSKPLSRGFTFSIHKENNAYVVNWQDIFAGIVSDLKARKDKAVIAYKFHFTCAQIIKKIAIRLRGDCGINDVAVSGGVFQNLLLLNLTVKLLEKENFHVYFHKRIPANDSGVSVGQAVVANAQI